MNILNKNEKALLKCSSLNCLRLSTYKGYTGTRNTDKAKS